MERRDASQKLIILTHIKAGMGIIIDGAIVVIMIVMIFLLFVMCVINPVTLIWKINMAFTEKKTKTYLWLDDLLIRLTFWCSGIAMQRHRVNMEVDAIEKIAVKWLRIYRAVMYFTTGFILLLLLVHFMRVKYIFNLLQFTNIIHLMFGKHIHEMLAVCIWWFVIWRLLAYIASPPARRCFKLD